MTNIELSDVELGAVSGGDFTITVPTPSASTGEKANMVAGAVASALSPTTLVAYGINVVNFTAGREYGPGPHK